MRSVVPMLVLLSACLPTFAKADTLRFTFTATQDPTIGNFSFELPSSPVPVYVDPRGIYSLTEVIPVAVDGTTVWSFTQWYANGFQFDSGDYQLSGATAFGGSVSSPDFLVGSYAMTEHDPGGADAGVLEISHAVTPEPSSAWLLATGAVGLAATFRRRRA